jgi:membrane protein
MSSAGVWRKFTDDLVSDDLPSLAAALAYYTTLALAPVVLIALSAFSALYPSAQENLAREVGGIVGPQGEELIRMITASTERHPDLGRLAGWIGAAMLLLGASSAFAQLQASLNRIWNMENRAYGGVWGFLRRRVLSLGVLLALLFFTIITLVFQAALNGLSFGEERAMQILGWLVGAVIYTALFASLYKWLPDGRIAWTTALRGGLLTTALFLLGRWAIGLYLGHSDTAGAFGRAGAVVVWLIWTYYSGLVFLLSAELLYALAHARGWAWLPEPALAPTREKPAAATKRTRSTRRGDSRRAS